VLVVEVNGYTIEPGANLRGANLEGANLAGANLAGANLSKVEVDKETEWPLGFDPEAAGAIID
jgi:hypothetical protein